MPSLRTVLSDTTAEPSIRQVLEQEFLVDGPRISLREQLDRATTYDSAIVFVHGVSTDAGYQYGRMEERLRERWPEAFENTLIVKLWWGCDTWSEWSSVIGTRTDQVYGMSAEAWSGTAKLADAIGRVQALLGEDRPICVMAYSQGCAVTIAALMEGLVIDNLVLMGSPLDQAVVRNQLRNTRLQDAFDNVRGSVINCSSAEDAVTKTGAVMSMLGASGSSGRPIGRYGLPSNLLRDPKVSRLHLQEVDHNESKGWWMAHWIPEGGDLWSGVTPEHFVRVLASQNRRSGQRTLLPKAAQGVDAMQTYVNQDTRRGWFGNSDRNSFRHTVYIPAHSTVHWHFDDKDDARYEIDVSSGTVRARLREAEWDAWERATGWETITADAGRITRTLKTTGINDATYRLEIHNPHATHAVASVRFAGWDR